MNDQSNALVTLQKEEEVSLISLNDEGSFNSLSENLLKELFDVLRESDQDDTTKVLVLKGAGRGFSAGHNLKEVQENQNDDFYRDLLNSCKEVMTFLSNLSKPVIEVRIENIFIQEGSKPLRGNESGVGFVSGLGKYGYVLAINSINKKLSNN